MRCWIGLVLLLVAVTGVQAQNINDVIPDLQLSDNVILVKVQPHFDDTNHTVSLFSAGAWHTIPYPADFGTRYNVSALADGTYVVYSQNDQRQPVNWIVDPQAKTFTRFESKCPPMQSNHGAIYQTFVVSPNTWITVQNGHDASFCHPFTGEYTRTFHTDLTWMNPEVSPDGRYLVIQAYGGESKYTMLSYDRETETLRELGIIDQYIYPPLFLSVWLTPTTFMMDSRDMPEWATTYIYIGDVAQENSFGYAIGRSRYAPRLIMEPLSFENMLEDDGDGPDQGSCTLLVYDVGTLESHMISTGELCEEGLIINDGSGDRLYRAASPELLNPYRDGEPIYPPSDVVRYNFETGATKQLYRGAVESIYSVSPKGTYAIVGLSDDELVHQAQDSEGNSIYLSFAPSTAYLMRLSDGAIIAPAPATRWLSDHIMISGDDYILSDKSLIYTITNEEITTIDLPGRVLLTALAEPITSQYDINYDLLSWLSFKGFVVFRTDDGDVWFYAPQETQPRLLMHVPNTFDVDVKALENNTLHISLFDIASRALLNVPDGNRPPVWSLDVRLR